MLEWNACDVRLCGTFWADRSRSIVAMTSVGPASTHIEGLLTAASDPS
jgi:hypothetical protein